MTQESKWEQIIRNEINKQLTIVDNGRDWRHDYVIYGVDDFINAIRPLFESICPECHGEGSVEGKTGGNEGIPEADVTIVCQECKGSGKIK